MAEGLRLGAALLAPVIPGISERIYGLLGLGAVGKWADELEWSDRLSGNALGEKTILFPKPEK
jgi:methionyl-tRNA synthetase